MRELFKLPTRIRLQSVLAIAGVVAVLASIVVWEIIPTRSHPNNDVCVSYETITNGGKYTPIGSQRCTLALEVVNTEAGRELGLSNRSLLPSGSGMLFVFDHIDRQCMWMKDMKFPLDMVWLSATGIITKVEPNISPSTYPNEFCGDDALFVIEVNAGVSKVPALQLGQHVNL